MLTVRKAIERKFVANVKGDPKGITQLARRCASLSMNHEANRIYPVLIVDEPALQTPGVNTYLARRMRARVEGQDRIAPLTVVTGDELELALPYIAAGDVTWNELLDAREERGEVTAKPFGTTFWEFVAARRFRRRTNAILGPVRDHLGELVQKRWEHLK